MTELPQCELRIVLDVKVEIDETRNHRAAGEVDRLGTGGHANLCSASDAGDAVPFDDDAAALDRRCATAVDDADVVEYDAAHLHRLRGRERQCVRDDCGANHPSKRSAHVWQARHSTSDIAWQHGIADRNRESRRYAEYFAVAATIP